MKLRRLKGLKGAKDTTGEKTGGGGKKPSPVRGLGGGNSVSSGQGDDEGKKGVGENESEGEFR